MSNTNLDRSTRPDSLSRIGGAAQGGSAKPKEERDRLDREHGEEQAPTGAGEAIKGKVGGNSNDNRTDEERAADKE